MKTKNKIFIISGPSGVGKTTISRHILKKVPGIKPNISCTTRPPRKGEQEGRDYKFITPEAFLALRKKDAFLEWAEVLSHFYGTLKRDVQAIMRQGQDVLLCIDVQGAEQVRQKVLSAVTIFILPPSLKVLRERLELRGEKRQEIASRIALARKEVKQAYNYDYIVVNDVLSQAVKSVIHIVYAERSRVEKRGLRRF